MLFPVVRSTMEKQAYPTRSGGADTDREQDLHEHKTITIYPLLQILRRAISPAHNLPKEQKSPVHIRFDQPTKRTDTEEDYEIQKQRSK